MAQPSASQLAFGDLAPALAAFTDDVVFGQVWTRDELSRRDRSLITVAALVAGRNFDQLRFHLPYARENGVTQTELVETITHLAFYAGWPKAVSALTIAKEVLADTSEGSDEVQDEVQ